MFRNGLSLFVTHFLHFKIISEHKGSYAIMWRRAEGDPNDYLVLGDKIMKKDQADRMKVELVYDEGKFTFSGLQVFSRNWRGPFFLSIATFRCYLM